MKFIWKGPPTAVEVWPEAAAAKDEGNKPVEPIFSGPVANGTPLDLPADHPQVTSWRAFKLIEAAPVNEPAQLAPDAKPASSVIPSGRKAKENANG